VEYGLQGIRYTNSKSSLEGPPYKQKRRSTACTFAKSGEWGLQTESRLQSTRVIKAGTTLSYCGFVQKKYKELFKEIIKKTPARNYWSTLVII
jgi:hypothetical protein